MVTQQATQQPSGLQMPSVPRFWAANCSVIGTDKEVVLLLGSTAIGLDAAGQAQSMSIPAAQINIPLGLAKDLAALLSDVVSAVEADNGVISTEFLRGRQQK